MTLYQLVPGSGEGQNLYDNLLCISSRRPGVLIKRKWHRAQHSRMLPIMVRAIYELFQSIHRT